MSVFSGSISEKSNCLGSFCSVISHLTLGESFCEGLLWPRLFRRGRARAPRPSLPLLLMCMPHMQPSSKSSKISSAVFCDERLLSCLLRWLNCYSNPVALQRLPRCATLCRIMFPGFGGPVAPTFSTLKEGVALQVATRKVSHYRGVSQLQCHLSSYNGPLRRYMPPEVKATLPNYFMGEINF